MIETILNTPALEVNFHSKNKVLYLEWKQDTSIEAYQRLMIECLEFGRHRPIGTVISDIRRQNSIPMGSQS